MKKILESKEYDFLKDLNVSDLVVSGSRAYGIENEDSDWDIRGVILNSKEEILLGRDFGTYTDKNTDTVLYSHKKFLGMVRDNNFKTLEILGVREEDIFKESFLVKDLKKNLDRVLTKQVISSILGFTNAQMRIIDNKMDAMSDNEHKEYLSKTLKRASESFYHQFPEYSGMNFTVENDKIYVDSNLHMPLKDMLSIASLLDNMVKNDKKSLKSSVLPPLKRMAKAQSQVLYGYLFLLDILRENGLNTYRPKEERELLKSIRAQNFISENKPTKEYYELIREKEKEVNALRDKVKLREEVDEKYFTDLMIRINEEILSIDK